MTAILKKHRLLIAFLSISIILLLAFFLRSRIFLTGDFLLLPDEARDLILVRDMIINTKLPLIGARAMSGGYIFHGPLWIWMLGIPFLITSGDPLGISYSFVILSLLIVLASTIVAYLLYGLRVGILVGLFVTASYVLVGNVPGTTNAHVLPLIFSGYLFFLIKYLRGTKYAFFGAAFLAGLGVQFEGIFAVPMFIYLLLVSVVTDRFILNIKNIILTGISFGIPLLTFILFDVRHQFLMSQGLFRLLTDPKGLGVMEGYERYGDFGFRLLDRINAVVSLPNTIMLFQNNALYLFLVGSLLGFFIMNKGKKGDSGLRKEMIVLLLFPLFIYTIFMYFSYPVWEHYVFPLPIVAAFIFAIALTTFSKNLLGKIILGLVVILLLHSISTKIQTDYSSGTSLIAASDGSYKNQLRVADYIFKDAGKEPFGYFVYAPQVYTYGMDYLLWWRGKYTYGQIPESKKLNTFYLVMYPPLQGDDNAHNFWKKNVIRTNAKVESSKTFPGGIIVEKRVLEAPEEVVDPNYHINIR